MSTVRTHYVALTDKARGGGPKVGAKRIDVFVRCPAGTDPDEIERVAAVGAGKRPEFTWVFGTYRGRD